jgi:hypothetical protein
MEPISTLNTRAPSLANKAAKGLPTTSDLSGVSWSSLYAQFRGDRPIDYCYSPPVRAISILEELIVDPNGLEDLYDREGCARKDRLDRSGWRLVGCLRIYGSRRG